MHETLTLIGTPISPFVRKVMAVLQLKGLDYSLIPQVPFFPTEEFRAISPMLRIPVLKHGEFILPDSTVIVQYLEDIAPITTVFPENLQDRAQARWLEEYADEKIGRGAVLALFFQKRIQPLLKLESDEALIEQALSKLIPECLDYLESFVPAEGYMFGKITVADIALTTMFLNANFADWRIDKARWPKTSDYISRLSAHPVMAPINGLAVTLLTTPRAEQQAAVDAFLTAR
ncbi:MAG: glutathione S-transferase family protein [Kordiimonadaceae bacterium]|nr:glutathione S-transferase family protein [Kordiimonadaceae bacterium]